MSVKKTRRRLLNNGCVGLHCKTGSSQCVLQEWFAAAVFKMQPTEISSCKPQKSYLDSSGCFYERSPSNKLFSEHSSGELDANNMRKVI